MLLQKYSKKISQAVNLSKLILLLVLFNIQLSAQKTLSLKQAIEEGLVNDFAIKNAKLDVEKTKAVNKEVEGMATPQINGSGNLIHNYILPTSLVPASSFNPMAPPDLLLPVNFAQKFIFTGEIQVTQLLFNPAVFVGLKARKTIVALSEKNITRTELDVKEAITKAYYTVLVSKKRVELLESNITMLKQTKWTTEQMYKTGFVEKLDVERLTVSLNGLESEKNKVLALTELSENLLKFQIGIDLKQPIVLTEKLSEDETQNVEILLSEELKAENTIDYQVIMNNLKLTELDLQRYKLSRLPTISLFMNFGYNGPTNKFGNVKFYEQGAQGLNISIPLSPYKNPRATQAQIEIQKTKNSIELLKKQYQIKSYSLSVNLRNALDTYNIEKQNIALAEKVYKQTQKKYEAGTGSNLEIVTAYKDLVQAQTNYYGALYDIMLNKTEYLKALNRL